MKRANHILFMSAAIAALSVAAAHRETSYRLISSIREDGGGVRRESRISRRAVAGGAQRILWQELPQRPWAPPFPQDGSGSATEGDATLIIADRKLPDVTVTLARIDSRAAAFMDGTRAVRYSARGVAAADDAMPAAFDEAGVRSVSIDGEVEVLFDMAAHRPVASKYHLTRTISPSLWREDVSAEELTSEASVAWSIIP